MHSAKTFNAEFDELEYLIVRVKAQSLAHAEATDLGVMLRDKENIASLEITMDVVLAL